MKQGKVFEKLAARKNVSSITFAERTCTVTLTDGREAVCNTAHEARLFIEGKQEPSVVRSVTPTAKPVIAPQPDLEAFCPAAIAEYCTVSADWARFAARGMDDISIPADVATVRLTQNAFVGLVLNNILAAA